MIEVFASTLVYAGLGISLFGAVNVVRPLRVLRVRTRGRSVLVAAAGVLVVIAAASLPAQAHHTPGPTQLDALFPDWEFGEWHSTRVHAPAERVYQAIHEVTADEIWLFRTLTWIRNPRRTFAPQPPNILAPPAKQPILDVATRGGFVYLADAKASEIAVGAVVCCRPMRHQSAAAFAALTQPGLARAGMNFVLADEGGGWTRVSTETRVHANDGWTRRRFAVYWRLVYPGSALIRRSWLRAIKARAEAGTT